MRAEVVDVTLEHGFAAQIDDAQVRQHAAGRQPLAQLAEQRRARSVQQCVTRSRSSQSASSAMPSRRTSYAHSVAPCSSAP
jgi:hypothetical protein